MERAVISSKGKELTFPEFQTAEAVQEERTFIAFREMERQYIMQALARCEGKVSGQNGAAALLGLNPQTLYSKIKRLGIQKKVSMGIGSGKRSGVPGVAAIGQRNRRENRMKREKSNAPTPRDGRGGSGRGRRS